MMQSVPTQEKKLKRAWTLWFDSPEMHNYYAETIDPRSWKQNIDNVCTFDTIENFWRLYNNIVGPNELGYRNAYYIFEKGTAPHCLDLNNQNGVTLHYALPLNNKVEDAWLLTIMLMFKEKINHRKGKQLILTNYLNGASLKRHKDCFELTLWLRVDCKKLNDILIAYLGKVYADRGISPINHYILTLSDKFA